MLREPYLSSIKRMQETIKKHKGKRYQGYIRKFTTNNKKRKARNKKESHPLYQRCVQNLIHILNAGEGQTPKATR